jgi:hypothetical protein
MPYDLDRSRNTVVPRSAQREIQTHQARGLVERAIIDTDEATARHFVEERITNGYALAEHALYRANRLNYIVGVVGREDPMLERVGRQLEAICEISAADLINRYMTRR